MWIGNKIFKEDLDYIINVSFIDWKKFNDKTVFITGATGLIGYYLVSALIYRNLMANSNIKIIALVRNMNKAINLFCEHLNVDKNLKFVLGDLEHIPSIDENIDYIVHGASPTESSFMVNCPVETIKSIVLGSSNVLELAKNKSISGMVYLSSMEVYGDNQSESLLKETESLKLHPDNLRDCYPIGKSLVENMNLAYFKEYNVPINSIRISQTIGAKDETKDIKSKKIISEIIKCILEKKNIVLQTKGESKRTYIYIRDVITAILIVLLSDKCGEIYNVSNEDTYSSIYEMANNVAKEITKNEIEVVVKEQFTDKYPKTNYLNLSSEKLSKLGWKSSLNLNDMFEQVINIKICN